MRIGETVSMIQYKKMEEMANNSLRKYKSAMDTLSKAKGLLESQIIKSNYVNAIIFLESLRLDKFMWGSINKYIVKSAKSPNNYCKIIKAKCLVAGRLYSGFNKDYHTFNNLPDWFVYEAFKEKAISTIPGSFSLRFRDALVAFILNQQKYEERMQKR